MGIDMVLLLGAEDGLGVVGIDADDGGFELALEMDPLFSPVSRRLLCCTRPSEVELSSVRSRFRVGGCGVLALGGVARERVGVPGALVELAFARLGLVVILLVLVVLMPPPIGVDVDACFRMLASSVRFENVAGSLA